MIKYEGFINEYYCNIDIVNDILSEIDPGSEKFVFSDGYSREKVLAFLKKINDLLDSIRVEKIPGVIERKETEEEAKEYFGKKFVDEFNRLLTELDRQQTVVFLHGTNLENCSSICEQGLLYKDSDLTGTAIIQEMTFGEKNIEYDEYKQLLNWPHKEYKGIVIIAVPYECFYKEGLWNHFKNSEMNVGDYKIDSDFIVGFIDVERKQIIINPKYNRQHNYTGYIRDNELFKENKTLNNLLFAQDSLFFKPLYNNKEDGNMVNENKTEESLDAEKIAGYIEDIRGTLNSIRVGGIRMGIPGKMDKKAYETNIAEINENVRWILQLLPYLKTEEELQKEKEEWSVFQSTDLRTSNDFDWGEWPEWFPEENGKIR